MQVLSASPAATYTGVTQALTRISSVEGARALWRGVASVILGAGPAHAVYFGAYEMVKESTGGNEKGHHFASTAFAGASATIASDAFMNPFDGTLLAAAQIWRNVCLLLLILCPIFGVAVGFCSHQAAHADARVGIPDSRSMCTTSVPTRGASRILCLVSNNVGDDSAFHCRAVQRI